MVVNSAGNVGIGTTSPSEFFQISANSNSPVRANIVNSNTGTAAFAEFKVNSDVNGLKLGVGSSGNTLGVGGSGAAYIGSDNNYPLQIYTNGNERMRVTGGGNVGIGTTAPGTALDVTGQIRSQVYNAAAGTSFNWNNGNIQYTSATCSSFSFTNMKDGGVYTLIVKSTTSGTCVFSQAGLTFRAQSALITASGSYTIFNFIVAGADVFVKMQRGF